MHAVHPRKAEIEGVVCVPRIADLPVAPDGAFVAVRRRRPSTWWETSRGSALAAPSAMLRVSPNSAPPACSLMRLLAAAGDLALVGPNCFGIINYVNNGSLWSVPYRPSPRPRGAAVIGQSGNLCINLSMNQREVPFSYIISAGNQAVLGFEDYVEVLAEDGNVTAIGLFLEGIRDVQRFSAACLKALQLGKPVVALRAGVSELGAKVAASHTNSLAGQTRFMTCCSNACILRAHAVAVPRTAQGAVAGSAPQRAAARGVLEFRRRQWALRRLCQRGRAVASTACAGVCGGGAGIPARIRHCFQLRPISRRATGARKKS